MTKTNATLTRNTEQEVYDVDIKKGATPKQLAAILDKARQQARAEIKVAKLEDELKGAKKQLFIIKSQELPKLMQDAGEDHVPLGKGFSIRLEKIVTASIPSPDSDRVEDAEEKNRVGIEYIDSKAPDLIKNQIVIEFGKGEEKWFNKFMRDLRQRKKEVAMSLKRTVHGGTLGKWVRGQDALGMAVDEQALNVRRVDVTEIIAPANKNKNKV